MDARIEDFATAIAQASSQQQVLEVAGHLFENFGFKGTVYCARNVVEGTVSQTTSISDSVSDWREAYFQEGDDRRDPLLMYNAYIPTVFLTGREFLTDHAYLQNEDIAVIRRAEDFGLISGLAFNMPKSEPNAVGGWNLTSELCRAEIKNIYHESASLLHICATLADREFKSKINRQDSFRLTKRETECLSWLASGMRTDQIAHRLNIKPVTVDLHIRNARERLGARTREQALAIAIHAGLIKP